MLILWSTFVCLCFPEQAMTLMEYLIKTGSERVAQQCRENIYAVQTLKDFQFIDRDGKDQVCVHTLQTTQGLPNRSRCEAPLTGIVKRAAWNPFKVFLQCPPDLVGKHWDRPTIMFLLTGNWSTYGKRFILLT